MYTIDLLDGTKLPARSRPVSVAAVTLCLLVPVVAAAFMVGGFLTTRTQVQILHSGLAGANEKLASLADVEKVVLAAQGEEKELRANLSEVAGALKTRVQMSRTLTSLAESLPASVTLSRLAILRRQTQTAPDKPTVRSYTLELGILTDKGAQGLKEFMQYLRFESPLKLKPEAIQVVSQVPVTVEERDFTLCVLQCALDW
ncbi:MAG: hypothetical protein IH624_06705 [Phycisphaerae bacterium]|nr:hypothetical protein [Phycisphaerae bacterium]